MLGISYPRSAVVSDLLCEGYRVAFLRWFTAFADELGSDFRGGLPYVIWFVLTIIVGFAGPFGTYQLFDLPVRLIFWAAIMALAIGVGISVRAFVHGVLGLRSFRYGSSLIAIILAAIFPPVVTILLSIPAFDLAEMVPDQGELALFVFLTSLGVGAYRHGIKRLEPASVELSTLTKPQSSPAIPRLLSRLPSDRQGRLVSISVRDHYIDVVTEAGTATLLMRLSDAIEETAPEDGAQVHRSHWVAWAAVTGVERTGSRMILSLTHGGQVPVSRTYRDLVEARGIGMTSDDGPQVMAIASSANSSEKIGSSAQRPPV